MTVRPDNRLATMPMRPVVCRQCGTEVLVRKASWAQTSVQWGPESRSRCKSPPPGGYGFCPALRESIKEAVTNGTLDIVPDGPTGPDDLDEPDGRILSNGASPNGSAP